MLIRVKRIDNVLLFHACFIPMSHVSPTLLYHFEAFYWTNLLTRCPEPIPCVLLFCISENLLQENSSELDENLRELFLR